MNRRAFTLMEVLLAIGITIIVMGWFRKGPRRG